MVQRARKSYEGKQGSSRRTGRRDGKTVLGRGQGTHTPEGIKVMQAFGNVSHLLHVRRGSRLGKLSLPGSPSKTRTTAVQSEF